jgi:hypothetical protein
VKDKYGSYSLTADLPALSAVCVKTVGEMTMIKKKEAVAMLLAGGQGSRLHLLTERLAKLPFRSEVNTESLISRFRTASIPG